MARKLTLCDWILAVLQSTPTCELEQLVNACPDYTWNEVLLEVDTLSRSGEVRIEHPSRLEYTLTLIPPAHSTPTRRKPDWSAR